MKSKKAEVYLNRVYKPGTNTMKHKAYSRENTEKATESFCKTICDGKDSDCETCTLIKIFKNGLI